MIDLGDKTKKYCVQVYFTTSASKCAGNIYCDSKEEYNKILDDNIDTLYDEGYISVNCSNDFDVGDIEVEEINFDEDKSYFEVNR